MEFEHSRRVESGVEELSHAPLCAGRGHSEPRVPPGPGLGHWGQPACFTADENLGNSANGTCSYSPAESESTELRARAPYRNYQAWARAYVSPSALASGVLRKYVGLPGLGPT